MDLMQDLHTGWAARLTLGRLRQAKLAAANARVERAALEGMGRLRMEVDADVYHYWGQRLGYECWNDPQWLREFERDNPEVRVPQRPRRTSIVVP